MGGNIGGLVEAERALADARHLRDLYGARAENWCANALAALPAGDPRRNSIRLIAKALHSLPADGADSGGSRSDMRPARHAIEPHRRH